MMRKRRKITILKKRLTKKNNFNVFFWLVRDSACNSGSGYCCSSDTNNQNINNYLGFGESRY